MKFHSLVRNPYLYDFNAKSDLIRKELGYTELAFQKALETALIEGLAWYEKDNLHFWSYNQDRKYLKTCKKDDYCYTKNIDTFVQLAAVHKIYHKQTARIYKKEGKQANVADNTSAFQHEKSFAPQNKFKVNRDITLSCRKAAQILGLNSPASGYRMKQILQKSGLIDIHKNKVEINKESAMVHIKAGRHNVRHDKDSGKYFFILADIFSLNFRLRKTIQPTLTAVKSKENMYYNSIYF